MWDQRYNEEAYVYGKEPNDFLKAEYSLITEGGRVLCIAEGEGRNAVFLARQGYEVTAVDQSSIGLKKAENLARERGVGISTIATDLADFDPGSKAWDGIVSISAHLPPVLRKKLHKQLLDSLKTGGVFILEAFTPGQLEMVGTGGPPQKDLLMSLEELRIELEGLEFIIGAEVERTVAEGKFHQGQSAVVQILGRKKAN